jgi:hypothetical protein
LCEVWKHEARGLSQWLQNNIEVLNEALDLKLVNVDPEQHAGDFSIAIWSPRMRAAAPWSSRIN